MVFSCLAAIRVVVVNRFFYGRLVLIWLRAVLQVHLVALILGAVVVKDDVGPIGIVLYKFVALALVVIDA